MRTNNTEKKKREAESNYNKCGSLMKIIKYVDSRNVYVEFQDEHRYVKRVAYHHFKNGQVRNPYEKTIYGVACIGDTSAVVKSKQFKYSYQIWISMITRCYSDKDLTRRNTYRDCFVCYEYFEKWFNENYYEIEGERMCLDKDILFKNNKIYSPETCMIVPERINMLFINQQRSRGEYPIGVSKWLDKRNGQKWLIVQCSINEGYESKLEHLGHFSLNEPFHAFYTYKTFKDNYIKQVADEYKDIIPKELYNALYKYEVEIND